MKTIPGFHPLRGSLRASYFVPDKVVMAGIVELSTDPSFNRILRELVF